MEWISVEKETPKTRGWYYTYTYDLPFEEALKYDMAFYCDIMGFNKEGFRPTHWMPLPEPPKE